ncbi:MAG: type II toxin-antitoxin system VapC family toxin [Candidatus Hodarchaeales archaeon]
MKKPDSVCLDTRILSMFLKGKKNALRIINEMKEQNKEVYTTTINVSEFYMGYYKTNIVSEEKSKKLFEFFQLLNPKPLDFNSAKLSGKLYAQTLKDNPIGWRDTFIAAITLLNGKEIITTNIKHFSRIPDLKIVKFH